MELELIKKLEKERKVQEAVERKLQFAQLLLVSAFLLGLYICYDLFRDDKVMAYSAPPASSLNAPIRPKKFTDMSGINTKDFLIDSVRKYLRAKYPKNSNELRYLYEYVRNHSEGVERSDYISRLSDLKEVSRAFDQGTITAIYIKDVDMISVGFNKKTKLWNVEIPARKVKFIGLAGDERLEPLISLSIKIVEPTRKNDGFIVTDYRETIVDPVTKEVKLLNKETK